MEHRLGIGMTERRRSGSGKTARTPAARTPAARTSAARAAAAKRRTAAHPVKAAGGADQARSKARSKAGSKARPKAPAKAKPKAARGAAGTAKKAKTAPRLSAEQAAARKALEKQVKGVSREIDKAEREAKKSLRDAEKRYRGILSGLKADRARLQKRLQTLASQGENAFDEIRAGVEAAYRELSEAVVKAYGHFR